jgi:hypothetical protein
MKIGPVFIPNIKPWSRRNFIPRIAIIVFFIAWAVWGVVLFKEGREIEARIQQRQLERQREEERLRRMAAYEQRRIEEKLNQNASRNAVDGL